MIRKYKSNWACRRRAKFFVSFFFLAIVLFTFSCKDDEKPKDVLKPDRMRRILIELHKEEAAVLVKSLPFDSAVYNYRIAEKDVLKKYGLDSAEFYDSYYYYLKNIERFNDIYEEITDSAMLLQTETENQKYFEGEKKEKSEKSEK